MKKDDIQEAEGTKKLMVDCDPEARRDLRQGNLLVDEDVDQIDAMSNSKKRTAAVTSYFSAVPADASTVSKYAADGADLLHRSMKSDEVSDREQARMLHGAMSRILHTHHKRKRSLIRFIRRDTVVPSADVLMDFMVDAMIDGADVRDKKWMQMLAIGAVSKTVKDSMVAQKAGETEFRAMEKIFKRFA